MEAAGLQVNRKTVLVVLFIPSVERDGTKRENGVETALPDAARIGLADVVFLDFRKAD